MRKRIILGFLFLSGCFMIYQSLFSFWTKGEKHNYDLVTEKHHLNYDYNEELPNDITALHEKPYEISLFERFKDFFSSSLPSSLTSSSASSSSSALLSSQSSEVKDVKIILFWTSWFQKPWWVRMGRKGLDLVGARCPETRCIFTHDKNRLQEASALLFQSQRFSKYNLPTVRNPDQRWVWVHVEPPTTSHKSLAVFATQQNKRRVLLRKKGLSHLFNWTMTYHPDSDVMEPYGALVPVFQTDSLGEDAATNTSETEVLFMTEPKTTPSYLWTSSLRPAMLDTSSEPYKKYQILLQRSPSVDELMESNWEPNLQWDKAKTFTWWFLAYKRTRHVAWISSHCPTFSRREEYVSQLQNYIGVDAYGTCGTYRCGSRQEHRDDRCWKQILARKYLFYLSFENSMCDGYITEKLWRPLAYGLVPIVMGGANYSQFLPPKSYINALDYSPEALGQLLRDLQDSPDYYIQYHLWRVFWKATERPPLCELCQKLHSDKTQKIQRDISAWWYRSGSCDNPAQWPLKPT